VSYFTEGKFFYTVPSSVNYEPDRFLNRVKLADAIERFFGDGWPVAAWTSKNLRRTCAPQPASTRNQGSQRTLRWRKPDSNPRSPGPGELCYRSVACEG
jgi:hypothetical protein